MAFQYIKKLLKQGFQAIIALSLITVIFCILSPSYRQFGTFFGIMEQSTILACCAIGSMLVLISGGLDLSIGSIVALVSVWWAGF